MTDSNFFTTLPSSIQTAVELIVEKSKPKKLILFGSRARGDARDNSDFDLCVIGRTCSEDVWNQLIHALTEDAITLYPIDLVEFEKLTPPYQENIQKEGKLLYG